MDKASASGAGDSRFESWAGHCHFLVYALKISRANPATPSALLTIDLRSSWRNIDSFDQIEKTRAAYTKATTQ